MILFASVKPRLASQTPPVIPQSQTGHAELLDDSGRRGATASQGRVVEARRRRGRHGVVCPRDGRSAFGDATHHRASFCAKPLLGVSNYSRRRRACWATLVSNEPFARFCVVSTPTPSPRADAKPSSAAKRPARARGGRRARALDANFEGQGRRYIARGRRKRRTKLPYDVLQLGASGASTLKRGILGSLPQAAHGPAAEASSSAASSSSVVGGGGGDGS